VLEQTDYDFHGSENGATMSQPLVGVLWLAKSIRWSLTFNPPPLGPRHFLPGVLNALLMRAR